MENENSANNGLIDRLSFEENRLYLDRKEILNVPGNESCAQINIAGVLAGKKANRVFVGTGGCCHGYLLEIEEHGDSFELDSFFSVDFNIFEMTPLEMNRENYLTMPMLVTGYGCTGSGARIFSVYDARAIDVVTSDEYREFERGLKTGKRIGLGETGFKSHKLNLDYKNNKIGLELYDINRRVRAGMTRQKGVPECLMTAEEEYWISDKVNCTMDLTEKLKRVGVDIPASLELAKDFKTIRRR